MARRARLDLHQLRGANVGAHDASPQMTNA